MIIVTGPVGVGKTTVTGEMGAMLSEAGVPHATVDFDELTRSVRDRDDDWGNRLGLANLKAVWRNYRRAGAGRLIVARVIESRRDIAGFRAAIPGADITVVRLRAPVRTLQARVRRRGAAGGIDVGWHVARAAVLGPLLERQGPADVVVETDGRRRDAVAKEILVRVGWIGRTAPGGTSGSRAFPSRGRASGSARTRATRARSTPRRRPPRG